MLVHVDTALRVVFMLVPAGKLDALKNRQESESQGAKGALCTSAAAQAGSLALLFS